MSLSQFLFEKVDPIYWVVLSKVYQRLGLVKQPVTGEMCSGSGKNLDEFYVDQHQNSVNQ